MADINQAEPNEAVSPPPVPAPVAEPRRRGGKKTIVAVVLAVLVVGGLFAWYHYGRKATVKTPAAPIATTPDKHVLKIGTIVDENGAKADEAEFAPFIDYLVSKLQRKCRFDESLNFDRIKI